MKRLRRIVWNGLAVVSALLCVATCVLGIRSHWYKSEWEICRYWNADGRAHRDTAAVGSYRGGLIYAHFVDSERGVTQYVSRFYTQDYKWNGSPRYTGVFAGFGFQHQTVNDNNRNYTESGWRIALPYWFVAALFGLPAAGWWLGFRRERRAAWRLRHTRCFHCGYDLRATPDCCPECGTVPIGK